jgi:hypothetical protein
VNGAILITVVFVRIDPAVEESRVVVRAGQLMTSGVGRGDGGIMKVQSPLHPKVP